MIQILISGIYCEKYHFSFKNIKNMKKLAEFSVLEKKFKDLVWLDKEGIVRIMIKVILHLEP
jgi:hypothetical protein